MLKETTAGLYLGIEPITFAYLVNAPRPPSYCKLDGDLVPISVLIVPKIATPIQNSCRIEMENMPHLEGLKLANPITDNNEFLLSILIGANYFWSFVQDHIIRGNGPTAQQSRLAYLLSGPLLLSHTQLSTSNLDANFHYH